MKKSLTCIVCGSVDKTKRAPKGNLAIEILCWCLWILPGVVYTIWRQTTYREVCKACGSDQLIPSDSPILGMKQVATMCEKHGAQPGRVCPLCPSRSVIGIDYGFNEKV